MTNKENKENPLSETDLRGIIEDLVDLNRSNGPNTPRNKLKENQPGIAKDNSNFLD